MPKSSAVDAEAICRFFFPTLSLVLLLLGTEEDMHVLELASVKGITYN